MFGSKVTSTTARVFKFEVFLCVDIHGTRDTETTQLNVANGARNIFTPNPKNSHTDV